MQQLIELANLDIQTIMAQLDLDIQAAQDFKSTFSSLGGQLLLSGFNALPNFGTGFQGGS